MTLGEHFKKAREHHELSQKDLAEILDITAPSISQIETDERNMSLDLLFRFLEIRTFRMAFNNFLDENHAEKKIKWVLAPVKK